MSGICSLNYQSWTAGWGVVPGTLGLHLVSRKHSDDLGPPAGV